MIFFFVPGGRGAMEIKSQLDDNVKYSHGYCPECFDKAMKNLDTEFASEELKLAS